MAQYIDKSALVAEIERRRDAALMRQRNLESIGQVTVLDEMVANQLNRILSFINNLEVKEVDLEKDVRQIISLYYEGIKHYEDIIKKGREENGGSDLAIKIMDGVVDARELSIQYVIDKLKAQKGEEV